MGDVVDLSARKDENKPHAAGMAHCLACKHEWAAVAAVPIKGNLDCPACGASRGVFKYPFDATTGDAVWNCDCGNDLMRLVCRRDSSEFLLCIGCGNRKPVVS